MKPKSPRRAPDVPRREAIFAATKSKALPHPFVLDALDAAHPETRPMFGCLAVYVGEKIMLVLRDKPGPGPDPDKGVWLATVPEHHASLRRELPSLRSISVLGSGVTGWQMLPASSAGFEEEALHACELILKGDPRIGKIPGEKKKTPPRAKSAAKTETKSAAKSASKAAKAAKTTSAAKTKTASAAKRASPTKRALP